MKSSTEIKFSRIKNLHRRLGMLVALFLILLTVSGVLLNHTENLGLAQRPVAGFIGSALYNLDQVTEVEAWQVNDQWLYAMNHKLYLEAIPVDYCDGSLVGVVALDQRLMALCASDLLIIDQSGQLVERISVGVPSGVTGLAQSDGALVLRVNNGLRRFDLDSLESSPWSQGDASIEWNSSRPLPDYLLDQLQISVPEINMERLILDIHSGRILGSWRQFAMDLLAILILVLAVGGMVMLHLGKG
ncbi:MAG: PepSY domain-containing protein [Gammaproteobacteria bacterium]|nr:PepSY domain-containing protein [Gammaproteobacteria bacterium]